MDMKRKYYAADTSTLAEQRQVRVVVSTDGVDRAGEVVKQDGISVDAYKGNPIILWNHNPDTPVARAVNIGVENGKLVALAQFPPAGTSQKADEVYGLITSGIVNSASIGFNPDESEPMDPQRPRGPQRYLKSELMEFSFVSVPANTAAAIIERSHNAISEDEAQRLIAPLLRVQEVPALKTGKTISKATATKLNGALAHHAQGMQMVQEVLDQPDAEDATDAGSDEATEKANQIARAKRLRAVEVLRLKQTAA